MQKFGYVTIKSEWQLQIVTSVASAWRWCAWSPDHYFRENFVFCLTVERQNQTLKLNHSFYFFVSVIVLFQNGTTCWDALIMRLHLSEDCCKTPSHPKHITGSVLNEFCNIQSLTCTYKLRSTTHMQLFTKHVYLLHVTGNHKLCACDNEHSPERQVDDAKFSWLFHGVQIVRPCPD